MMKEGPEDGWSNKNLGGRSDSRGRQEEELYHGDGRTDQ